MKQIISLGFSFYFFHGSSSGKTTVYVCFIMIDESAFSIA